MGTFYKRDRDSKVEVLFADAVITSNKDILESLLEDKGEYHIYGDDGNPVEASRNGFISWILEQRTATEDLHYYLDACIHCVLGAPVVIFNEGHFPKRNLAGGDHLATKERSGFMLEIDGTRIKGVRICHSFLKTENQARVDSEVEKIDAYMKLNDCCFDVAAMELGLVGSIGTPPDFRYDPVRNYLLVAEFTDKTAGNKGYILTTYENIRSAVMYGNKVGLFELGTTEGKPKLLEMFQHRPWYRINNADPVKRCTYEVPTPIVTYRIIDLSPDYTARDFVRKRSQKPNQ